jgi:hypothetical protein
MDKTTQALSVDASGLNRSGLHAMPVVDQIDLFAYKHPQEFQRMLRLSALRAPLRAEMLLLEAVMETFWPQQRDASRPAQLRAPLEKRLAGLQEKDAVLRADYNEVCGSLVGEKDTGALVLASEFAKARADALTVRLIDEVPVKPMLPQDAVALGPRIRSMAHEAMEREAIPLPDSLFDQRKWPDSVIPFGPVQREKLMDARCEGEDRRR